MDAQTNLINDKPVVDLSFLSGLLMREKDITNWRDADTALGELAYLRSKFTEVERTKDKMLEQTVKSFEEPLTKLDALKGLYEGKLAAFTKKNENGAGWERTEDANTGKVVLSKTMEHGGVSIVTKMEVRLNPVKA